MKKIGTFSYCTNCLNKRHNCCTDFGNIDNPLISEKELNKIKKNTNKSDFYINTTQKLYRIKTKNNKCIFYINNKCTIYDYRPIDCRIFPFDVIKNKEEYYIILYKNPCDNFSYSDKFVSDNLKDIEKLIKKLYPFLEEYSCDRFNKKLRNKDYIIIEKINML